MAVTATFTRFAHSLTVPIYEERVKATFTGTYATGGFTWNPLSITAGGGTSPLPASRVDTVDFYSPLGYTYVTSVNAATGVATTKIFTTANTELANTTAVPDASLTVVLGKAR
jgi:hypothetical protein